MVWVACGGGAPKSASFDDDTLPFVSTHSIPVNLLGERMCTCAQAFGAGGRIKGTRPWH